LFHVAAHFLGDTDGAARFAGSETVIEEQTVVGGLEREEIFDENLMGGEFEFDIAEFFGLGFNGMYLAIVLRVVEFFFLRDFGVE
jgi:hypothetical protein